MIRTLDDYVDDKEGIIMWDMASLSLTASMKSKVKRYLKDGCVHKLGNGVWEVCPIAGHTHLTHTVVKQKDGSLSCTCQRWRTKGLICTHILAVLAFEGKYKL